MNQAWVRLGSGLPNSAVPVLPAIDWPGTAAAVPVPVRTTSAVRSWSVAATPAGRAVVAPGGLSASSRGARQVPEATAAATVAMCSGLASTRPCPMASDARSAVSLGAGNDPPAVGRPRSYEAPNPKVVAAAARAASDRLADRATKAVLHDWAKAVRKVVPPREPPSYFMIR